MKFTISRELLASVLAAPSAACNPGSVVESQRHIMLEATDNSLVAFGYNDGLSARSSAAISPDIAGSCMIPGDRLFALVQSFPADQITVQVDAAQLQLSGGRAKYKLPIVAEIVSPPMPEMGPVVDIPAKMLRNWLELVVPVAGSPDPKGASWMQGVLFDSDGSRLAVVATNSGALHSCSEVMECPVGHWLPDAREVSAVMRMLPDAEDINVTVEASQSRLGFRWGNNEVSIALLSQAYAPYGRIFDRETDGALLVDNKQFVAALTRINKATRSKDSQIRQAVNLSFADGELSIRSLADERGSGEEAIPADHSGGEVGGNFNLDDMLQSFKSLPPSPVLMKFSIGYGPIIITSSAAPQFMGALMPIKE